MTSHFLSSFFSPKSVAIVGASDKSDKVGGRLLLNMTEGTFKGKVYPVNPKYKKILGLKSYPDIDSIPNKIELAVIATPAQTVTDILRQCGEKSITSVIIITAGFGELGKEGKKLQKQILEIARLYQIHVIGPNCLGVMCPENGVNATFSNDRVNKGHLALVSQSGAVCTAIIDWAKLQGIGFSAVVSTGAAVETDFGDILDYLALDPNTSAILLYVEGVSNSRRFLSGLKAAAFLKPVILIKSGRFESGKKAAMSHTGALVGNDDIFQAAIERSGVVRVNSISQLFSAARLLSNRLTYNNDKLAIITNAGGPGVMCSDRAMEIGLPLAELDKKTITRLNEALPKFWSRSNPIDILGDATPERFDKALEICLEDENIGGILIILTPQAMTNPTKVSELVAARAEKSKKPLLISLTGGAQVKKGREILMKSKASHFNTPESAVDAFQFTTRYHKNRHLLKQIPSPTDELPKTDARGAHLIIDKILSEGRNILTIQESKALLSAFKIPVTHSIKVNNIDEAMINAEMIGMPVVLKLNMVEFTHKSDVGGVKLNITDLKELTAAYHTMEKQLKEKYPDIKPQMIIEPMYHSTNGRELMIGVLRDPVFGVAISFGLGGTMVEVLKDSAVALPPLNHFMVKQLIQKTKAAKFLGPFRNMPEINRKALINVLLCISNMVSELPEITELDINPLLADDKGCIALDARICVASFPHLEKYAHMAIHPYPSELIEHSQLPNGTQFTIRPIRPEDATMVKDFVHNLSKESKYFRFMHSLQELTSDMLIRFTQIDYDREMAFIAVADGKEIGIGRYIINPDKTTAEFALVIADEFKENGLGMKIMEKLMQTAKNKGITLIQGEVLASNKPMLSMMNKLNFTVRASDNSPEIMSVYYDLRY